MSTAQCPCGVFGCRNLVPSNEVVWPEPAIVASADFEWWPPMPVMVLHIQEKKDITDEDMFLLMMEQFKVTVVYNEYADADETGYIIGKGNDNTKVEGYTGFFILVSFDEDGTFRSIGAWE